MSDSAVRYLGIEGGGTRTIALVADHAMRPLARLEFGPCNVRLLSDAELLERFREIRRACGTPSAIGLGIAGVRTEPDRLRVAQAVGDVWPNVPHIVTHDLAVALASGESEARVKVLVLSGTGSCCYGEAAGEQAKVGGWGHILGDRGSGYDIAISALRAVIYEFDRHGRWNTLGQVLLRELLLNAPEELIDWVQRAPKAEIAAVAPAVFEAAQKRDRTAREILKRAADTLANDAVICARRIARKPDAAAFLLAGSVLLKQPSFAREVTKRIRQSFADASVEPLAREAAWGAVRLATKLSVLPAAASLEVQSFYVPRFVPEEAPTEQRNPRSMEFDRLPIADAVSLMLAEEKNVSAALLTVRREIEAAVRLSARALHAGGRLIYAGAGTSGRLGVLDASECPPTFRASPEMVQGIIAGGQRALWQAVEGAEDNAQAGADAVRFRGVAARDVLIGIAASGRTPFVWGALAAAREGGAKTVLLHFNPSLRIEERPDVVIAPNLGPEVLTGSTRLKCGTATKLVLNIVSTISMARLGKVIGNLMVDLNPSNTKLRDRAVRIVQQLTGCKAATAREALEKSGWVVKTACTRLKRRW